MNEFYDPFHPYFIRGAIQEQPWMKCLVFGLDSLSGESPPGGPSPGTNPIFDLFNEFGKFLIDFNDNYSLSLCT